MRFPSFYLNAPPLTHFSGPKTHPKAEVIEWTVFNPPLNVIKFLKGGASFRLSKPEGCFALANQHSIESNFIQKKSKNTVTVYCLWFGCRLPSHEPLHFTIEDDGLYEIIKGYKYRVAAEINKPNRVTEGAD